VKDGGGGGAATGGSANRTCGVGVGAGYIQRITANTDR